MGVSVSKHVHFHLRGSKLGKWKGICETEHSESLMKWGRKATKYMRFVSDMKGERERLRDRGGVERVTF